VQPDLLLLDEAFSALDIGLKSELYRLLAEERDNRHCAVLMITTT
jgi:NitT/TauT family transport system ATP-binding protein